MNQLSPKLNEGVYVFCTVSDDFKSKRPALGYFREAEGKTLVMEQQAASEAGLDHSVPMAWITLQVHSSLEAVGLTAAVSTALAKESIACNVIAAYHHDHLFVPLKEAEKAIKTLRKLKDGNRYHQGA